jgi:hypothetical protein
MLQTQAAEFRLYRMLKRPACLYMRVSVLQAIHHKHGTMQHDEF